MQIKKITPEILYINFPKRVIMNSTMMRFQEYYENPVFKGKVFTHEEFRKWYIKNSPPGKKTGRFTYNNDWWGFNMPLTIFKPFYEGKFNPLTIQEKELLKKLESFKKNNHYLITAFGKVNMKILKHEIAHGLFYTNKKYKKEIVSKLKEINKDSKRKIFEFFKKHNGYHKDVWTDELHAYILCELDLKYLKRKGIPINNLWEIHSELNKIFEKYF